MRVKLNEVEVEVKKFEHTGPLLVQTTRGEVKCQRNDYIVTFGDGSSCVLPATAIEPIIKEALDEAAAKLESEKVLTEDEKKRLAELTPPVTDSFNHAPLPTPDPELEAAKSAVVVAQEKLDNAVEKADLTETVTDKEAADLAAKELDEAQKNLDDVAKRKDVVVVIPEKKPEDKTPPQPHANAVGGPATPATGGAETTNSTTGQTKKDPNDISALAGR